MADKDLNNQLEDLFSDQEDPPIRVIKPSEPSSVVDEKRQQAQLREEEQLTVSSGTKSGGGRMVDEATGMELGAYLAILWRRKWVIAVTLAVTVTVVVIGTLTQDDTHVRGVSDVAGIDDPWWVIQLGAAQHRIRRPAHEHVHQNRHQRPRAGRTGAEAGPR